MLSALPTTPAQRRSTLRVLLIDRSTDDIRAIRETLAEETDLRIQSARDVIEARALLAAGSFDAALIDNLVWMADGPELLRAMRASRAETAIILLMSGEDGEEPSRSLKRGAHDFVTKPGLDGKQLADRIQAAVAETRTVRRRDTMVRWLEREARTDHLTGLYARGAFDDRLRDACAAARERGTSVTVVVVDVVGTQTVNEVHGHEAGDSMIRRAAAGVSRCVRAGDFAARIGGDDFGIIVAEGNLELGRTMARRIAHEMERMNTEDWSREIPVALKFGVAEGTDCQPEELFAAAEQEVRTRRAGRYIPPPVYFAEETEGPSVA